MGPASEIYVRAITKSRRFDKNYDALLLTKTRGPKQSSSNETAEVNFECTAFSNSFERVRDEAKYDHDD